MKRDYLRLTALSTSLDMSHYPHSDTSASPTFAVGALSSINDGVIASVRMMKVEAHAGLYMLFEHGEDCIKDGDAAV